MFFILPDSKQKSKFVENFLVKLPWREVFIFLYSTLKSSFALDIQMFSSSVKLLNEELTKDREFKSRGERLQSICSNTSTGISRR